MNKKLKSALQSAFEAPPPADKEQFLKMLPYPKTTYRDFLFSQFSYIRKRVWLFSAVLVFRGWALAFLTPVGVNWHAQAGEVWIASALLPFLALLTVTELCRSAVYRMSELEASCRFSLSQIVMARISLLGGGNFTVLALLLIFIDRASLYGVLRLALYLIVPYLLTCGLCLLILNREHGQESIYACAAAACSVCLTNILLGKMAPLFYSYAYWNYWLILSAASTLLVGIEMRKLLKQWRINYGTYS